jgi:hypothetical protein
MWRAILTLILCSGFVGHIVRGESSAQGVRELIQLQGMHWRLTWSVPEAKLADVSAWNSKRELPLSPAKAVSIARAYLNEHGFSADRPVVAVDLRRPQRLDSPGLYYFYFITFDDLKSDDWSKVAARAVVLLDGTVVTPVYSTL